MKENQYRTKSPRKKSDILLKGTVEDLFPHALRFFYPNADEIFNMAKGFEWMNKELHEIQPQLSKKGGSREADILVKVFLLNGNTELILLHLEIQKRTSVKFACRVYQYNYRLSDKYDLPIVSLALFTGPKGQLQPNRYCFDLLGTKLTFEFKTYQIFNHTEEELLKMDNPFGLAIIAAQQEAMYGGKNQENLLNTSRKIAWALARSEKFNYKQIHEFLYFMSQLIPLTDKKLKLIFDQEIKELFGGNITMGIMEAIREVVLDEGREEGRDEGIKLERARAVEEKRQIACNLKKIGMSIEVIAKATKLSIKEIEAL